jgi:hypothetical protein
MAQACHNCKSLVVDNQHTVELPFSIPFFSEFTEQYSLLSMRAGAREFATHRKGVLGGI